MPDLEVNLAKTYDAVIIGSGAAGGMAAHVCSSVRAAWYAGRTTTTFLL